MAKLSPSTPLRWLFIAGGWVCLVLATAGVVLPILPTTPLVLLAAFCFSRGSERVHRWLLANRIFGPLVRDWQRDGVIRPRAKITATAMLVALFAYTLVFVSVSWVIKGGLVLIAAGVLRFIWTRPSAPQLSTTPEESGAPVPQKH